MLAGWREGAAFTINMTRKSSINTGNSALADQKGVFFYYLHPITEEMMVGKKIA